MKAAIPGGLRPFDPSGMDRNWIHAVHWCHGKGSCAHRDRRRRLRITGVVASARRTYGGHENGADMPGTNGIDTVRAAKTARPEIQFLMLTIFENPAYIFQALCAGATGYLLKSTTSEELEASIHDIHQGGSPMNSTITRLVVNSFQQESQQRINDELLTEREKYILDGLAAGMMYKEIAAKAEISTETVRVHVRKIYSKLHVSSRMEAIRKVYPKGH